MYEEVNDCERGERGMQTESSGFTLGIQRGAKLSEPLKLLEILQPVQLCYMNIQEIIWNNINFGVSKIDR